MKQHRAYLSVLVFVLALEGLVTTHSRAAVAAEPQAEGIITGTDAHERISLDSNGVRFQALYRPDTSGYPRGGAIILPPLNAHPDWPGVVHLLRTTLPEFGWSTLSLQLPTLSNAAVSIADYDQELPEIARRIETAVRYFNSKGIGNIALIGKGVGASAAAGYLASAQGTQIQAFVGISMRGIDDNRDSWLYSPNSLSKLSLPVLDIYGSLDYRDVINSVKARGKAARQAGLDSASRIRLGAFQNSATAESAQTRRAGYIAYRQISLSGADGHYSDSESYLVKRVIGWLKQHAGGITISQR